MSASFSLFETSLLSARRSNLKERASKGNRGAAAALELLDDIDSMLATILLWNNFANVTVASLATVLAVRLVADTETVLTATSVITTLTILILAEITPKSIGVRYSEQVSCVAAPILKVLSRVVPIGKALRLITSGLSKVYGTENKSSKRSIVTVGELLAFIHDKDTLTDVDAEQKAMLYKLIGLHELALRDLMVPRSKIQYIDLEDPMDKIVEELHSCSHHMLPLCEDGLENVVGLLRVRNCLSAARSNSLDKNRLRQLAIAPIYAPETLDPIRALRSMLSEKRQLALVVDEYGGLIGMATVADYFHHLFESTLDDLSGSPSANGQVEDIGTVNGDMLVREANLNYNLQIPGDESSTVAGLIIDKLGAFPSQTGASVKLGEVQLVVAALEELEITKVLIQRRNAGD